jgi:hypothetical protein
MSRILSHSISLCLIGTGGLAWTFAGRPLIADPSLAAPLNPLGINGSPYGEVFAMAMQGPIDTYFDLGMDGGAPHEGHSCADGEKCTEDEHESTTGKSVAEAENSPSLNRRFENFLTSLGKAAETRTNPNAASSALRLYLRRQAEDKLRFAYQLDPAHYGNYNSLHLFLTEPQVGTRPQLTSAAAKLAEDTIQYCFKQNYDPRPALTAAAAAANILQLMFEDQHQAAPKFNTTQMRQYLDILDYSLARYDSLAKEWDLSKNWQLISPQRIEECTDRLRFNTKMRDTSEKIIIRFESKLQPQASN